jgi:hypothetical protein
LQKIVSLLNNQNEELSNKQAKLDILKILGNLGTKRAYRLELQEYVQQIAEWFEEYMVREEGSMGANICTEIRTLNDIEDPKLHKAVLIVLARAFDYRLKVPLTPSLPPSIPDGLVARDDWKSRQFRKD